MGYPAARVQFRVGGHVLSKPRALIVDDSADGRRTLSRELQDAGFVVSYANDGFEALIRLREEPFDLVVTDFQMPGMDGVALLKSIRESSDVPVIVISAVGTIPICEEAMLEGAERFLQLSRDIDQLGEIAQGLLDRSHRGEIARVASAEEARSRADARFREQLQGLLAECDGNLSEMSRGTGRDRKTLRYHLRRFGLIET